MKSSAEWKKIEIISQPNRNDENFYEITISHDGLKDSKHIASYQDVNELRQYSLGDTISEYIDNYL